MILAVMQLHTNSSPPVGMCSRKDIEDGGSKRTAAELLQGFGGLLWSQAGVAALGSFS